MIRAFRPQLVFFGLFVLLPSLIGALQLSATAAADTRAGCETGFIGISGEHKPESNYWQRIAELLARQDETTWRQYLVKVLRDDVDEIEKSDVAAALHSASPGIRKLVLDTLVRNYRAAVEAKNLGFGEVAGVSRWSKRGLDFIYRHLTGREADIVIDIGRGGDARAAYARYFNVVAEDLKLTRIRGHDVDLALGVAATIQGVLRKHGSSLPVQLGGSLPNGRALPGISDIDIFLPRGTAPVDPGLVSDMKKSVAAFLERAGIRKMRLSEHFSSDQSLATLSEISPVALRIRREGVDLVVHPPSALAPGSGDPAREPRVFRLP